MTPSAPSRAHPGWIALFLLALLWAVFNAHATWLFSDHDDKSVLRAHAWLSAHPDDPLREQVNRHLNDHAQDLGSQVHVDYLFRLNVQNVYMLPDWLVLRLERLPLLSAYQSVFLANLLVHLVAAGVLVAVVARVFGGHGLLFLLLMLIGTVFLHPFRLEKSVSFHAWSTAYPRGAVVTWFMAALVLGISGWRGGIARPLAVMGTGACLLLAYLGHSAHFAVLATASAVALAVSVLLPPLAPAQLARQHGIGRFLLLFNGFIFLLIALEMVLFQGVLEIRVIPELGPRPWNRFFFHLADLIVVNLTLVAWFKGEGEGDEVSFRPAGGDFYVNLLVLLSVAVFAFKFGVVTRQLRPDALAFAWFEGVNRLSGLVNLLVLLLLTGVAARHLKLVRPFVRPPGGVSGFLLLALAAVNAGEGLFIVDTWASQQKGGLQAMEPFNRERMEVRISDLLAQPGVEAYRHMPRYFQAIANEMRAKHLSDTP